MKCSSDDSVLRATASSNFGKTYSSNEDITIKTDQLVANSKGIAQPLERGYTVSMQRRIDEDALRLRNLLK